MCRMTCPPRESSEQPRPGNEEPELEQLPVKRATAPSSERSASLEIGRSMDHAILDGIRIVELGCGVAGRVAAMLLAECGADVVRVESGEADECPGRLTWDRSKRSAALDLASPDGAAKLRRLLAHADVL